MVGVEDREVGLVGGRGDGGGYFVRVYENRLHRHLLEVRIGVYLAAVRR